MGPGSKLLKSVMFISSHDIREIKTFVYDAFSPFWIHKISLCVAFMKDGGSSLCLSLTHTQTHTHPPTHTHTHTGTHPHTHRQAHTHTDSALSDNVGETQLLKSPVTLYWSWCGQCLMPHGNMNMSLHTPRQSTHRLPITFQCQFIAELLG